MAVKVRIPTPLRTLTRGSNEVTVEGRTLAEAIANLDQIYEGFRDRLLDESGKLRGFINIYVNDEDIRFLRDLDTELKDGDVVSILPAIAGG